MLELVGHCNKCKKQIFCNDGFINGVVLQEQSDHYQDTTPME
jgi:hypothetical protein